MFRLVGSDERLLILVVDGTQQLSSGLYGFARKSELPQMRIWDTAYCRMSLTPTRGLIVYRRQNPD